MNLMNAFVSLGVIIILALAGLGLWSVLSWALL